MAQDQDYNLEDQASRPDPFDEQNKGSLFSPKQDGMQLPGDYTTPAAPPDDVEETLSKADARTDSGIQPEEVYDEGLTGATDYNSQQEDNDHDQPQPVA